MPVAGTAVTLSLDDASGTPADYSAKFRNLKFTRNAKTVPVETLGDTNEEPYATLKGGVLSGDIVWDTTIDTAMAAALGRNTTTYSLGIGGITYSGECVVTAYDITGPVDGVDMATFSANLYGAVGRA